MTASHARRVFACYNAVDSPDNCSICNCRGDANGNTSWCLLNYSDCWWRWIHTSKTSHAV